ncbi:pirin family protein [Noviherbaspirillum massiliense]|uniref:pirin family protein n=1 Tax=Noviherbaspirillum massiliense TaxID=1465823 RepID=UPI0002E4DEBC|nr:pirin family protein [Noviherbaspirillum massiliense]
MDDQLPAETSLETVVVPRSHDLGDSFEVRRALPSTRRRMVGPFVFLDQMGPHVFSAGRGLDVRPHPHIGLATVTYLFDGEIMHRDSLGSVQAIRPGEVNWMTAGSGIVHSERTAQEMRQHEASLFGLQCWVALPRAQEEAPPSFKHFGADKLPIEEGEGIRARIIAGRFFGQQSPVPTLSDLFYVEVLLQAGARMQIPAEYGEQALYLVEGQLDLGRDGVFDAGQLLVFKPGAGVTLASGKTPARFMLLGGEPMDGPRYLTWNFVSSSPDRIEQAKEDWQRQRFTMVPGETEFIPLPDLPGKPVHYP